MFCPNCGASLAEGSNFCGSCGCKLTKPAVPVEPIEPPVQPAPAPAPEPVQPPKTEPAPSPKKPPVKLLLGAAAALVVVLALIFGLKALLSGRSSGDAYVYLSDGHYELLSDLAKGDAIEIASARSDSTSFDLVRFSPDGKYLYYFTKYDGYDLAGTLCRAEYAKLKDGSPKNDNYIETIASNVRNTYYILSDGTLLYQNTDRTLYYYDGETSERLSKNVYDYYTDDSGHLVYLSGDDETGSALYSLSLAAPGDKTKIDSNVSFIAYSFHEINDLNNILYYKEEDDGSHTLYVAGLNKSAEKLAENAHMLTLNGSRSYFMFENGKSLSLYDYVDDPYAAEDADLREPELEAFGTPVYSYKMVSGSNLSEDDFDELYTSCTRDLYWYGMSSWWCYSMEDALDHDWGDNTDGIHAATQRFIDRFASQADEDGYILVTDEVKAALQEIQQYAENPEKSWQWLWLCYNKYQSDTDYDYDAYDEAYEQWYAAQARIELRAELQDPENAVQLKTLCRYENGAVTIVCENVVRTNVFYNDAALQYNTPDLLTETVALDDLYDYHDAYALFWLDPEADNPIILTEDGSVCHFSSSAADTWAEACDSDDAYLYFAPGYVYLEASDGLSCAAISDGVIGSFKFLTDDADVRFQDGSTLYYFSNSYDSGDLPYVDLCACTDGVSTRLARDILVAPIQLYDDGIILAYTDYHASGYELTWIDPKDGQTYIADDVTQYLRVDKSMLLYLSDGDLYVYNGKEKTRVASEVDQVWSLQEMDYRFIGWYDYGWDPNY